MLRPISADQTTPYSLHLSNNIGETLDEAPNGIFYETITDIHITLSHYLSIEDNIHLAQTDWFHQRMNEQICLAKLKSKDSTVIALLDKKIPAQQIFLNHPNCRKDIYVPIDEKGRAYLRSLGIGGLRTNRKIANGTWTIEYALKRKEAARPVIEANLLLLNRCTKEQLQTGIMEGIIRYCLDGSLSLTYPDQFFDQEFIENLDRPAVLRSIDDSLLTLDEAKEQDPTGSLPLIPIGRFAEDFIEALSKKEIQRHIDNDHLRFEHTFFLGSDANKLVENEAIQKYLKNGLLKVSDLNADNLSFTLDRLESEAVQKYVDNGILPFPRALSLHISTVQLLKFSAIQKYLDNGRLKMETLIQLRESSNLNFLLLDVIQKYIDNGFLNMEQALSMSYIQSRLLLIKSVQDEIDSNHITADKFLKIPFEEAREIITEQLTISQAILKF